ncbi:MAG: translocation/assembly module TamB domain-containing protein [Bacteroidetes bacterium]|nr:translocation/assembly module TamB domain-containing protein [Bacteroidota bacterium]
MLSASYTTLQSSRVQTIITKNLAERLSRKTNTKISIGKVDIAFFNKIILNDVLFEGQNNDTLIYAEWISAKIDTLSIRKNKISIAELTFENNIIAIDRDSANHFNFSFLIDSLKTEKDTSADWEINCNKFGFLQSSITFTDSYSKNKKNIFLSNLNVNISDFESKHDTIQLKLNDLNFNDGKKLNLEHFSANLLATPNQIEIKSINLKSKHSELSNSELILQLKESKQQPVNKPKIDFNLNKSKLSLLELAELVPTLRGMDQNINLSGRIYGDVDDLKGKNLLLKTGKSTEAVLDFYVNGISNMETMYLFFDLKRSKTTFSDISNIKLPQKSNLKTLVFPDSFYEAGMLSFSGNFSGFISDFVTFGTLESQMGILKTDISVVPKDKGTIHYQGRVSTTDFNLGDLLKNNTFGNITFNGEVDGNFNNTNNTLAGLFKGDISEIGLNNYVYKNIEMDGIYMDKMFDGLLSINDPNLKFDFQGQIDLNNDKPDFNFNLELNKFFPESLNLSNKYPNAELGLNLKAKFTGNNVDNLKGVIIVNNGTYKNTNGIVKFDNLQLVSVPEDSTKTLSLTSDFFDFEIGGNYHYKSLLNSFKQTIGHFLPAINFEYAKDAQQNEFEYRINVKNLDSLTAVFYPGLKFETPFLLYGNMKSENSSFELEGSIPGFQYKNMWFRNIFIANRVIDEKYSSKFKFGEILHKNGMIIYDFTIDSKIANNETNNLISWNIVQDSTKNSSIKSRSVFSASDSSNYPSIFVECFPSEIFIADTMWQFDKFTTTIDSSSISLNKFNLHNGQQSLKIAGDISKDKSNLLSINFDNLEIDFLQKSFGKKSSMEGIVNCSIGITDLYDKPVILSDITIDDFKFEKFLIGNINVTSNWDQTNALVNSEIVITKDKRNSFKANGSYNPETTELNFNTHADSLSLKLLGAVITKNLSDFQGSASGNVKIGGTLNKLKFNGALFAANAGLKIDYTQANYYFTDSVYFKTDTIQFDNIAFKDGYNNTGDFNGVLVHDNFKNMIYDLDINSPKILALNTTARHNEMFYGDAFANCKLDLTGQGLKVALKGSATTLKGTNINISMDYEGDVEQYDFVEFITTEKDDKQEQFFANKTKSYFTINLTVEATPEAKVQLVYNSSIGDVIKAQGEGILLFEMDKDENIFLSGDYLVTEGDYLFTLQNIMNKRFTIEQGGSIVWSGDPYNAIIDLTAIYKLKAALYDLMMESYLIQGEDIYQRIPVECKILLTEELTNPLIDFEIDFPEEDESLIGILQQFINTEEEMNKQILSLIVLGKFYTPEYLRGQFESQNPNTLGTTASEVFSNQLSNWLSQISNNWDVGFNYRPGNSITNDEIELALSTQIFNDRVTLNGNIGNNVNPESRNSSQIVGDFDMKVKLVPSGKIQFKAFNRSNNNLIYETAPYTQGVGLSFKEEYNTLNELIKKIGSIFKKKK